MGELPSYQTDSFEKAGQIEGGPVRFRTADWDYAVPNPNMTFGQYKGTFDIFERPGKPGLNERVFDGFFLDPQSLWKLKELALASGLSYSGPVNWAEVAKDCIGREAWGMLEGYKGKDGRMYMKFVKFAASLAELQQTAASSGSGDKTAAGRF